MYPHYRKKTSSCRCNCIPTCDQGFVAKHLEKCKNGERATSVPIQQCLKEKAGMTPGSSNLRGSVAKKFKLIKMRHAITVGAAYSK